MPGKTSHQMLNTQNTNADMTVTFFNCAFNSIIAYCLFISFGYESKA